MTEQQEPNQQALAELTQTLLHLSRALDEAHNLAASAIEDRDFAITERDELREQVASLRVERDGPAVMAARVEKLAADRAMAEPRQANVGAVWDVLRKSADVLAAHDYPWAAAAGRELADRLESEHAETAARDRLIAEAEATLTRIISGNVIDGYPRNAAASILAEYPGVINVLAEAVES